MEINTVLQLNSSGRYYLITSHQKNFDANTDNRKVFFIDPASATLVAGWLAEGAVAYVGGSVLSSILGETKLADIAGLIERAVAEIKQFLREEIRTAISENEVRRLISLTEATKNNLSIYSAAKDRNEQLEMRFLLENSIISSGELVSLASNLGMAACLVHCNAMSLRIMSVNAFYELTHIAHPVNLVLKEAQNSTNRLLNDLSSFKSSWRNPDRVRPITGSCEPGNIDGQGNVIDWFCHYWVFKDGIKLDVYNGVGQATDAELRQLEQDVRDLASREAESAINSVEPIILHVIKNWSVASQQLSNKLAV